MIITAINQFTLLDYPGKIACILFTGGCNFRCQYCHNSQFVLPEKLEKIKKDTIPFEAIMNFLQKRKGKLEGVVISGGEPTIWPDLKEKIQEIKKLGYLVKLDTNGAKPEIIKDFLENKLLDYIAMDVKTSLDEKYSEIIEQDIAVINIQKSIDLLLHSDIDYEFRSTIMPRFHTKEVLLSMAKTLAHAKKWYLQNFRNVSVLNAALKNDQGFTLHQLEKIEEYLKQTSPNVEVRDV